MKKPTHSLAFNACAAATMLLAAGAVVAAPPSEAQLRYQQERAACISGASNQDRATCLKEAGAALREARRGNLSGGNVNDLGQNRMMRCNNLPAEDRQDCEMRMQGAGSSSGSAHDGGILRELTRPVPAHMAK